MRRCPAASTPRVTRSSPICRSFVDVLDEPERSGGWEEVWRSLEMVEYFELDAVLAHTRELAPAQPRYLDAGREPGRLVKDWNLIVPDRVLTRSWAEVS